MRDPERIEPIIACLRGIWEQVPDWRFGQLLSNLLHAMYEEANGLDPFFMDDDRFMELVNRICKRLGVEEVRATTHAEPWEERCYDCEFLCKNNDHDAWCCDHCHDCYCKYWGKACKNVKECVNV
jgi:hypothetical protein